MRTFKLVLMAGALALAGCSNGDESESAKAPAKQTAAKPTPAPSPAAVPAAPAEGGGTVTAAADPVMVARGAAIARDNCLRCHASQPGEASTNPSAPSFATLFVNYPPDYIAEAFAEGVFVGHGAMPAFEFSSNQINDLVAYLKTLENHS